MTVFIISTCILLLAVVVLAGYGHRASKKIDEHEARAEDVLNKTAEVVERIKSRNGNGSANIVPLRAVGGERKLT